jgi:phosphohistidine swiveling domain-containing protein
VLHDLVDAEAHAATGMVVLDAALDPTVCGHKAAALAMLRNRGFDVPDGFVVPAGVTPALEQIAAALARLGDGPVAVRSSGVAEDLAEASFAGQYDTLLNVRGTEAVLEAIAACVRSGQSGRAEMYGQASRPMAVLVQQMVDADAAGVAFSANPVTGNRAEVRVSATRGLGDKLVSGATDADEWLVTANDATIISQPQNAVGPDLVKRVAALARRAEAVRLAPQDIEWAVAGDRLWLLQSRPITLLPVAPAIEKPSGTWQKDAAHFPEPLSPFAASTQFRHADSAFDEAIATWGLLPDRVRLKVIGHEPYAHVDPDDGGKNPPPWWLLGLVARLVPSLRRKLKTAASAIDSRLLETMPAEWTSAHRPRLLRDIAQFAATDLTALDDAALFTQLETLTDFYARSLQLHFTLMLPHSVGLYELAEICRELLGWELQKAVGLLQGLSNASTASMEALTEVARLASKRPETRQLVEARGPDVLAKLRDVDPPVAAALHRYLDFWGLRPVGSEAGCPTLADRPHLVTDLLADLMDGDRHPDPSSGRLALVEDARAQLTGAARERFDAALAYAERVYPLREDNVLLTDQLPTGLLRRVALEAGRRLVQRGLLGRADDAVMLTADELKEAVLANRDVREVVSRRKAEHAWVRANPGPMTYGPEPGKAPDLRGLPTAARRINSALLWAIEHELTPPPQAAGDAIAGIGACPGVYRGRVRVIRTPDRLHTLRAGEVLVCETTSAAWMMVFRRAGAIIADTGSVLSHTAIVAREFGLPAVVAGGNATKTLVDGEEVIVDGTSGSVTRTVASRTR